MPFEGRGARTRLLVVFGLVSLALGTMRLWHLNEAPFIQDEPVFVQAGLAQLGAGHWVNASPIAGTQGVHYGPSIIWFYGVVQKLLPPSALTCIAAMCLLVTSAQLLLAFQLTRLFQGGPIAGVVLVAVIASSPYQFFWSRLAWDQLVNALSALTVVLLAAPRPFPLWRSALIGLVLGLALSSHLMVAPLVAMVALVLAVENLRSPRELLRTGLPMAAVLIAVNLPYLWYWTHAPRPAGAPGGVDVPWLTRLEEIARVATPARIEYFFDSEWGLFAHYAQLSPSFASHAQGLLITLGVLALVGLVLALTLGTAEQRRIAALAALVVIGYPVFYGYKRLELHPHYQFPTWWVIPAGLAALLGMLRQRRPSLAFVPVAVLVVIAGVQLSFVFRWMSFIDALSGTRGPHYSAPIGELTAAVAQLCDTPAAHVYLANQTFVFPYPLTYLASVEPRCHDKTITYCQGQCPGVDLDGALGVLQYRSLSGGGVTLRPAPARPSVP